MWALLSFEEWKIDYGVFHSEGWKHRTLTVFLVCFCLWSISFLFFAWLDSAKLCSVHIGMVHLNATDIWPSKFFILQILFTSSAPSARQVLPRRQQKTRTAAYLTMLMRPGFLLVYISAATLLCLNCSLSSCERAGAEFSLWPLLDLFTCQESTPSSPGLLGPVYHHWVVFVFR